jgi:hypothetical protein
MAQLIKPWAKILNNLLSYLIQINVSRTYTHILVHFLTMAETQLYQHMDIMEKSIVIRMRENI